MKGFIAVTLLALVAYVSCEDDRRGYYGNGLYPSNIPGVNSFYYGYPGFPAGYPYGYPGFFQGYHGHPHHYASYYPYHGAFAGQCLADGIYYGDERSLVFCSNGTPYRQPCPDGTVNAEPRFYVEKLYRETDFCGVNLNDLRKN